MGAAEHRERENELCEALIKLADEMRASRDMLSRLEQTVSRFVVVAERQLASNEAVKRRAARQLRGMDPSSIAAMHQLLDRKLKKT